MALGTDYIIRYLSDISGAVKGAQQIETLNSQMGKSIQEKYGQAVRSIGQIPVQLKETQIKLGNLVEKAAKDVEFQRKVKIF